MEMHCSASSLCCIRIGRDRFGAGRLRLPSRLASDGLVAEHTHFVAKCNGEQSREILQLCRNHVWAYITPSSEGDGEKKMR